MTFAESNLLLSGAGQQWAYAPDEIQNIMFMPLDEKSFHWEHFSWCIIDIFIPFPRAIIPWTPFLRSFYRLWLPLPLNKFNSSGLLYIYFPAPKEAWLQLSSTGYNNIFYPPSIICPSKGEKIYSSVANLARMNIFLNKIVKNISQVNIRIWRSYLQEGNLEI